MIPTVAGLAEHAVRFEPRLLDLSQLADDQIQGEVVLRNTLRLLKYSRSQYLVNKLAEILTCFINTVPQVNLEEWIEAIGVYVMTVNKNIDQHQYKQTLESVLPTQYEVGSLADRLLKQGQEEGREEGIEEGILVGKIHLLEDLLELKLTSRGDLRELGIDGLTRKLVDLQQRLRQRNA